MRIPILCATIAVVCFWGGSVFAGEPTDKVVRIAQLVIDPAQLGAYQTAVKEEMAESVRLEPGVLAIYSVAEKEHPNRLHFFEIYANEAAYRSHIASVHFQKYVKTTQSMITSRVLIETDPVQLSTQAGRGK
ncbi:Antibiotic biosynthesis monooxygenase [Pseudomonas savastanoi pv. glycinea]|uniref:putative quinol monooxygenase n=1 Tax=Pseudomonas quasicaspiana TaxID=2829821 RepID=UPI000F00DA5A|nr:putative quinol monooxygenase [Pseudomonas quasicaspiana]MCD5978236.1 antibiotic biosynthesis monooxygenase [Pseudomonas quasicaspiana]RMR07059.1 Antibiotic biosynthesis monooxygenase [Pseudomonas savastanoi pv. glycinea]